MWTKQRVIIVDHVPNKTRALMSVSGRLPLPGNRISKLEHYLQRGKKI